MTYEAKKYISLENNELQEALTVYPTEVYRHDENLVTWVVLWDEKKSLQLFGVTKDGLAILQDQWQMKKNWSFSQTCKISQRLTDKKVYWRHHSTPTYDEYGDDFELDEQFPILVYSKHIEWPNHPGRDHDIYNVFWDGHNDFQIYSESYWDEDDLPKTWFQNDGTDELMNDTRIDFDDAYQPFLEERDRSEPSQYLNDLSGLLDHSGFIDADVRCNSAASASDVFNDPTAVNSCLGILIAIPIGLYIAGWFITQLIRVALG